MELWVRLLLLAVIVLGVFAVAIVLLFRHATGPKNLSPMMMTIPSLVYLCVVGMPFVGYLILGDCVCEWLHGYVFTFVIVAFLTTIATWRMSRRVLLSYYRMEIPPAPTDSSFMHLHPIPHALAGDTAMKMWEDTWHKTQAKRDNRPLPGTQVDPFPSLSYLSYLLGIDNWLICGLGK